jgi:hypothetical protein
MLSILNHDKIPIIGDVDILVIGAGTAGCCAAVAAKEGGAKQVAIIERYGFLGGTSTFALDTFYGFFTPGKFPLKVVGGLPDRVVDRLDSVGAAYLRPNTYGAGTGVTYDPEYLKLVWDDLAVFAGVRVFHHALLVDVQTTTDGVLCGVVIATKSGFYCITARRFIDASGDADLCHLASIPYEKAGELEPAQTLTMTFRICNVDFDRFEAAGGKRMLNERMSDAVETGRFLLPRKQGSVHAMVQPGCISTVAVRVANVDIDNFDELGDAEREGRRQSFLYESFLRSDIPGYENSRIVGLSTQIGVRETRRVYGNYRLTRDDCFSARKFDDRVLLCGAPIEDHRQSADGDEETIWGYIPNGGTYDVPYGTLVPKDRNEIWAVGRCFSATHDAHASCRSMAQTMSMGQAAGFAAALSLNSDCGAGEVDVTGLQEILRRAGAVLETPNTEASIEAAGWRNNR